MSSPETPKIASEQDPKRPSLEVTNIRENPEKAMRDLDFYGKIEQYATDRGVKQKEEWGDALTSATVEAKELINAGKENTEEENYTKADTVIEEAKKIAAEILKAIDVTADGEIENMGDSPSEESELDEELENARQNLSALLDLVKETQKDIGEEEGGMLKELGDEIVELEKRAVEALRENNVQQANSIIAEIDDRAQEMEAKKDTIKNKTPERQSAEEALAEAAETTEKIVQKHSDMGQREFHPSKDSLRGPHFTLEATLADLSQQTTEKIRMLKRKLDAISTEKTKSLLTEIEKTENKLLIRISEIETHADENNEDDMSDEELDSLIPFVQKINQLAEDIRYYENSDKPLPNIEQTQEEPQEIESPEENGEGVESQQDEPMKKKGERDTFDDEENLPTKAGVKNIKKKKENEDKADNGTEVSTPSEQTTTNSEKKQLKDEIREKVKTLSEEARKSILPEEELEKEMEFADVVSLKNILNSVEKMPDSLARLKKVGKKGEGVEKGTPVASQKETESASPSPVVEKEKEIIPEEAPARTSSAYSSHETSPEEISKENLRAEILALKKEIPEKSTEQKQLLPDLEERLETMPLEDLTRTRNTLTSLKRDALKKEEEVVQEKPEKPAVDEGETSTEDKKEKIESTKPSPFDILDLENPKEARGNLKRILKEIQSDVRRALKNHNEKSALESASEKLRKKIVDVRTSIYELEYMPKEDARRSKAEKTATQRIEKTKELYHELIEIMGSIPDEEQREDTEQISDTEDDIVEISTPAEETITDSVQEQLKDEIRKKVQTLPEVARNNILPEEKLEEELASADIAGLKNILNSIEKIDNFDKEKERKEKKTEKEAPLIVPLPTEESGVGAETIQETQEKPVIVNEKGENKDVSTEKEDITTPQLNEEQPLDKQGEAMTHLIEKLEQQEQNPSKNEVAPENTRYTQEEIVENLLEQEENLRENKKENREGVRENIEDVSNFDELKTAIEQNPNISPGFIVDFLGQKNSDAVYGKLGYKFVIPKIESGEFTISRIPNDEWGIKRKVAELLKIPKEMVAEKKQSETTTHKEPMDTITTAAGEITEDLERASIKTTGRIDDVQDVITGSRIIRKINKSIESGKAMTQKDVDVMNGWFGIAMDKLAKLKQPEAKTNEQASVERRTPQDMEKKIHNKIETPSKQPLVHEEGARRTPLEQRGAEQAEKEMEKMLEKLFGSERFLRKKIKGSKSNTWNNLRQQNMQEITSEKIDEKEIIKKYKISKDNLYTIKEYLYNLYEKTKIKPNADETVEAYIKRALLKS